MTNNNIKYVSDSRSHLPVRSHLISPLYPSQNLRQSISTSGLSKRQVNEPHYFSRSLRRQPVTLNLITLQLISQRQNSNKNYTMIYKHTSIDIQFILMHCMRLFNAIFCSLSTNKLKSCGSLQFFRLNVMSPMKSLSAVMCIGSRLGGRGYSSSENIS